MAITADDIKNIRTNRSAGSKNTSGSNHSGITSSEIKRLRENKKKKAQEEERKNYLKSAYQKRDSQAREDINDKASEKIDYSTIANRPDYSAKSKSAGDKPGFFYNQFKDSMFDFGQFDDKNVNTIEGIKNRPEYIMNQNEHKRSLNDDKYNAVSKMSDSDIGIYNYLFNTEGKSSADEYLDEYIKDITASTTEHEIQKNKSFAEDHPVLGSLWSSVATVAKPEGIAYSLNQKKMGEEIDANSSLFGASTTQSTIRNTVKEDNNMGKVGGFLYDTGMSVVDSLLASTTGATSGALMLAGGAASDTAQQVKKKGGTDSQAVLSGLASGAAEGIFERVSLGNLKSLKDVPISTVKDVVMNTVKSTFVNASEEAATELTNVISDYFIMGDLSDYRSAYNYYISQGYDETIASSKAKQDMAKRIGIAAAGGALAGGGMAAVGQATNYAEGYFRGNKINKQGLTDSYIESGKNMDTNSELYNLALEIESNKLNNKKSSNYKLGNLVRGVDYAKNRMQKTSNQKEQPETNQEENNNDLKTESKINIPDAETTSMSDKVNKPDIQEKESVNNTNVSAQLKQTSTQNTNVENNTSMSDNALESQNTKPLESVRDADATWSNIEGAKVKGIVSVENGNIKVNIESGGETVVDTLENVSFSNPEVQKVYNAASDYKTNGAKAFTSNYKGDVSLEIYRKAFNTYYDAGVVDFPMDNINTVYSSYLPESVRMNAYNAGINDAKIQTTKPVNKKSTSTKKSGGVEKTEASKMMDSDTRDALDALVKATGIKVRIEDTLANGQANGTYKDGTLHIALDSDNPYMAVAKHEITHAIQQYSPEKYKAYKDFVIKEINKNDSEAFNLMVERLISRYSEIDQNLTRDEAMDEIVADASEMFLTDTEAINRLVEQDRSLAEKIIEIIKELIEKIQMALKELEPKSKAAIVLNDNLESVKIAEELWIEALADISNNIEQNNTEGNDLKYQLKDVDYTEYYNALKENKRLKEINLLLEEQFKLTQELKPNEKQIKKVAKEILKNSYSSYPEDSLIENLTSIWKFNYEHPGAMETEEMIEAINGMSVMILKKSTYADKTLLNQSQEMLDYIKKTPLMLSQRDRSDLASEGGIVNFRKKYLGKIKIVTEKGIAVDTFYQELSEKYPEYFDSDITHPADQLIKIADIIDFIKPIYYNPYGMSMEESTRDLTNEIITSLYFDIKEAPPTFADKKKIELEKIRMRYNQKVKELHTEYKTRYNERLNQIKKDNHEKIQEIIQKAKSESLTEEQKQAYRDKIAKLKDDNLQKLKAQQQRYEDRMKRSRDRRKDNVEANKYKEKIKKNVKTLSDMITKPSDDKHVPAKLRNPIIGVLKMLDFTNDNTKKDGSMTDVNRRFRELQQMYANLETEEEELSTFFDKDIEISLQTIADISLSKRIVNFNKHELETVSTILEHLIHVINSENKMFNQNLKDNYIKLGEKVIGELMPLKKFSRLSVVENSGMLKSFTDMMNKGILKPYYFFKQLGNTMQTLYKSIRDGEDSYVRTIEQAAEHAKTIKKKYNYDEWSGDNDNQEEFINELGYKINLTIGEKLYLYLAYRREQGKGHIINGGIIPSSSAIVEKKLMKGIKVSISEERAQAVSFSDNDMVKLTSSLTEEQIKFAEEMGEYLSNECADLGNEISLQLYGYKKFTEKNYIPINSASQFLFQKAGVADDIRIKRAGFTKALTQKASNPIIAADLMNIWAKHVNDMAMYNSFVLPMEDFTRVWNYKDKGNKKYSVEAYSVKSFLQNKYGTRANDYIKKFLNDVNGGIKGDSSEDISNKLITLMKRGSVMANLSVAIQQPSSLLRAFAVIDPKYFGKAIFDSNGYKEMMQYSPQAKLKQWGYFDTNMGRSIVNIINEKEYDTPIEKFKALFKDADVRDEVYTWLPQKLDEITWSYIWNAVKEETKATTSLDEGNTEFYYHVSERFKEVIDRTQVMDSVFQRVEMMRSQGGLAKMTTAFMSEPMVNYNMIHDAIMEYRVKGKDANKYIARSMAALAGTMVLNALLKSIIGALRDDEDKKLSEKYIDNFISNLLSDPVSMIPYANQVASIFQGYNATRPDMQLFQNLYYAYTKLDNDKYTAVDKFRYVSEAMVAFFGVPLKNIDRDIEMVWRNGAELLESIGIMEGKTDYEKLKVKYPLIDSSYATGKYYEILYQAKKNGDSSYDQIYKDLIAAGKKKSDIEDSLVRNRRKELVNRNKGEEYTDPSVKKAYEAYYLKKDNNTYQEAKKELNSRKYTVEDIVWAMNELKKENPTAAEFIKAYQTGDKTKWKPIYDKLAAEGWNQKDIIALIK